jgi:predicted  nucleic acid-binding Zn-ribbon protein
MKHCQCGAIVPDSARSGQTCPKCGKTWVEFHPKERYREKKWYTSAGCLIPILLVIAFFVLRTIVEMDIQKINISQTIANQWETLNADSVLASCQILGEMEDGKRQSVLNQACKKYAAFLNEAEGQHKIGAINFILTIDSLLMKNRIPLSSENIGNFKMQILNIEMDFIFKEGVDNHKIGECARNVFDKLNNHP